MFVVMYVTSDRLTLMLMGDLMAGKFVTAGFRHFILKD